MRQERSFSSLTQTGDQHNNVESNIFYEKEDHSQSQGIVKAFPRKRFFSDTSSGHGSMQDKFQSNSKGTDSDMDKKNDKLKENAACEKCLTQNESEKTRNSVLTKAECNFISQNSMNETNGMFPKDVRQKEKDHFDKFLGFISYPKWKWLNEPEYIAVAKPKPKGSDSVHQVADSFFSSSSGFTDFAGFFNLCIILLILSNTRVALENVIKYGILVQPLNWMQVFIREPYSWPSFILVLLANVFIFVTFWTEKQLSKGSLSERSGMAIHIINLGMEITFPAAVVWERHPFPIFSSVCLAIYVVVFLKLISYVQVNGWCRQYAQQPQNKKFRSRNKSVVANMNKMGIEETVSDDEDRNGSIDFMAKLSEVPKITRKIKNRYPKNLTLKDLYYFMLAPTLCYELEFPRSARIRKRFLIKRIAEMVFLGSLILSLIQQWILPTVHNTMTPFQKMHFSKVIERLLKLSVPNHIIWLIFFYWLFHSCLNVLAEVLKFGDRTFYRDWWNAESVQNFWQNWNIPVHRWASRHLYKPMLRSGYPRLQASITVFVLSAFFHEYLVSIPLQMFRIWAFAAMISQVPMAIFVKKYLHGRYGNMAVWMSLIIGQPVALMMYYHDYFILNHGKWGLS